MTNIMSTKEKILFVAINLFSKKGYSGVSIREITREVGIKESSFYNHFKSKDEIIITIFEYFRNEFAKTLPSIEKVEQILANSSILEFFEQGFDNFKKHLDNPTNEKLWRILYTEQFRHPLAREILLTDIISKTLEFLEFVFEKLISQGKIRSLSPTLLATEYQYPIFAMITEYIMLRFDLKKTDEIENRMKEHVKFFLETIKVDDKV